MSPSSEIASLTFVGNATTLVRIGGFTVLTDPNFLHAGQRAYLGYGLWSKRRHDPAFELADLPSPDAVVLSHLHGDHFDREAKRGLPPSVPIVTTTNAARKLRRRGFRAAEGIRTWEAAEFSNDRYTLRITSVPAQHGPKGVHRLLPSTMGSILDLEQHGQRRLRLYVTGDTLFRDGLAEIGERFPDIDAMLIHLGGTKIAGVLLTMDGDQGARLADLIRPTRTVPIHYDDYTVMRSPLSDFQRAMIDRGVASEVLAWTRGDTLDIPFRSQPVGAKQDRRSTSTRRSGSPGPYGGSIEEPGTRHCHVHQYLPGSLTSYKGVHVTSSNDVRVTVTPFTATGDIAPVVVRC
jgi:L-ascorbate metabolism protein UlaG (beta-lactamase superfamily)